MELARGADGRDELVQDHARHVVELVEFFLGIHGDVYADEECVILWRVVVEVKPVEFDLVGQVLGTEDGLELLPYDTRLGNQPDIFFLEQRLEERFVEGFIGLQQQVQSGLNCIVKGLGEEADTGVDRNQIASLMSFERGFDVRDDVVCESLWSALSCPAGGPSPVFGRRRWHCTGKFLIDKVDSGLVTDWFGGFLGSFLLPNDEKARFLELCGYLRQILINLTARVLATSRPSLRLLITPVACPALDGVGQGQTGERP